HARSSGARMMPFDLNDAAEQHEPTAASSRSNDTTEIREALATCWQAISMELWPAGTLSNDGNEWLIGDIDGAPGDSCGISAKGWFDFADTARGGSLISAVGRRLGLDGKLLFDKCRELVERHRSAAATPLPVTGAAPAVATAKPTPICPVPPDARDCDWEP